MSHEWLSAKALSSKVASIMKVILKNKDAFGPLAVARQLHQHYSGKLRRAGREFQRVKHARTLAYDRNVAFTYA